MKELPFGPYFLYPSHFSFTRHYYVSISNCINIVELSTLRHTEIYHPDGTYPSFLRVSENQGISDRFPTLFVAYEDGKCFYISQSGEVVQFAEINSRRVYGLDSGSLLRCLAICDDYVLTTSGDVFDIATKKRLFGALFRPTTPIIRFENLLAVAYSDNSIVCSDGRQFRFAAGEAVFFAYSGQCSEITFEINNPSFYIACFQFFYNYLIAIMNTGVGVVLNLLTNEIIAKKLLMCEDYSLLGDIGGNIDENWLFPLHFECCAQSKALALTTYAVEFPVKNLFLQTTKIIQLGIDLNVKYQPPATITDFFPYDPINHQTIEIPDFGCIACNFGFRKADLADWTCCGCGRKLQRYK